MSVCPYVPSACTQIYPPGTELTRPAIRCGHRHEGRQRLQKATKKLIQLKRQGAPEEECCHRSIKYRSVHSHCTDSSHLTSSYLNRNKLKLETSWKHALILHRHSPSILNDTTVYLFIYGQSVSCRHLHYTRFAIFGVGTPKNGAYDPEVRTRPRFLYNAPTHPVSSSYV